MFTGLVKTLGTITSKINNRKGATLSIKAPDLDHSLDVGDSIAVNGVCLTVNTRTPPYFNVQIVQTTLEKTNLIHLETGDKVNLEPALKAHDALGGHFVNGHINDVATIEKITRCEQNVDMTITYPTKLHKYMILEGSITLEGVSLTIAALFKNALMVSIIPHTWKVTTLKYKKIGDKLNLEVDVLAKYIERLLSAHQDNL